MGTNKGAVGLSLSIRALRICFVNAHLAAHQEKLLQRNLHVQEICRHLRLGHTALDIASQFHTVGCWLGLGLGLGLGLRLGLGLGLGHPASAKASARTCRRYVASGASWLPPHTS